MTRRTRMALGLIGLLIWLAGYSMVALVLGVALHEMVTARPWGWVLEVMYYVTAGVAWALPLRRYMIWMNRPDPGEEHAWPK